MDNGFNFHVVFPEGMSFMNLQKSGTFRLLLREKATCHGLADAQEMRIKAPTDISWILEQSRYIKSFEKLLNEEEEANIVATPCDQGHYGVSNCGNCLAILPDNPLPKRCPTCGVKLGKVVFDYPPGGSDF